MKVILLATVIWAHVPLTVNGVNGVYVMVHVELELKNAIFSNKPSMKGELCKGVTSEPCQLKPCLPIDCKWSNWSSCDSSCGYGMEKRRILQPAEYDGKECEGYATRSCHLKPCDPGT